MTPNTPFSYKMPGHALSLWPVYTGARGSCAREAAGAPAGRGRPARPARSAPSAPAAPAPPPPAAGAAGPAQTPRAAAPPSPAPAHKRASLGPCAADFPCPCSLHGSYSTRARSCTDGPWKVMTPWARAACAAGARGRSGACCPSPRRRQSPGTSSAGARMSAAGAMQWARTRRMSLHTGPLRRHTARILPCERARRHVQRRRGSAPRGAGPRLDGHQRGRRGQQQVQAGGQQLVAEQPRGVQHALQEVRQQLRAPPRSRACWQSVLCCTACCSDMSSWRLCTCGHSVSSLGFPRTLEHEMGQISRLCPSRTL